MKRATQKKKGLYKLSVHIARENIRKKSFSIWRNEKSKQDKTG